jgi:hypothetical protein
MIVDNKVYDELSRQAKASPRLRLAYDLRNTPEDARGEVSGMNDGRRMKVDV